MGNTEHCNNRVHTTKHTRSSILSYTVGLDLSATSYLVCWTKEPITFLARSFLTM